VDDPPDFGPVDEVDALPGFGPTDIVVGAFALEPTDGSSGASPTSRSPGAKMPRMVSWRDSEAHPLIKQPPRPPPVAPVTDAPKRSSSHLANKKLALIPTARRGEVLLMRRFELVANCEATSGLNGVFNPGVSRENADVVLNMFPLRKKAPSRRQVGVIIA
jgi:hypothetical protein